MANPADIAAAAELAQQLAACLDQELAALRAQDMDAFEALQDSKQAQLRALSALAEVHGPSWQQAPEWQAVLTQLQHCHDAHRRNETILRRQLDVVRMALAALTSDESPALYDHLAPGGSRAQRAARAYGE